MSKPTRSRQYLTGYKALARSIVRDKERSTAIYRRFDELAARSLLCLQSELIEAEAEQNALDEEDARHLYAGMRDWALVVKGAKDPDNHYARQRLELAQKIRSKLKEFPFALGKIALLDYQLRAIQRPSSRTLEAARNIFHNAAKPGKTISALAGRNGAVFDDDYDLLSLRTVTEEDRLTRFLQTYLPVLFMKQKSDLEVQAIEYSERRIRGVVVAIHILLAAVLLFGAIFNLYLVTDNRKRLALIAGYTMLFALCVGLFTNARRAEIFTACAAYAAVLVVFVGSSLGKGGN